MEIMITAHCTNKKLTNLLKIRQLKKSNNKMQASH